MKKEYIILALIIAALSAYLVLHKKDSTHYTLPVLDDLSGSAITEIDITRAGDTLHLVKDGDHWVVGDARLPAMASLVETMIKDIKDLKLTALVSESKSYSRYELDDSQKIHVTAKASGKDVRAFDIGKTASSYRHTFIKIDQDTRVYHADGNFRNNFNKTTDDLSDKSVLSFDTTQAKGMEIKDGDKAITLVRNQEAPEVDVSDTSEDKTTSKEPKEVWTDQDNKIRDADKANDFVSLISSFKCRRYITGQSKETFTDPIFTVTIHADKDYTLSVFAKKDDEKDYPAISSGSSFPFLIPDSKLSDMQKKISEI